jgi:hypothetical protein
MGVGAGSKKQEARSRKQEAGSRKQEAGSRKLGARSRICPKDRADAHFDYFSDWFWPIGGSEHF